MEAEVKGCEALDQHNIVPTSDAEVVHRPERSLKQGISRKPNRTHTSPFNRHFCKQEKKRLTKPHAHLPFQPSFLRSRVSTHKQHISNTLATH
jgi:hypothetical protein